MGKYEPLRRFLESRRSESVAMTFAEIEKILGFKLPASHRYRAWWSNNSFNNVMTNEWIQAGYKTEQVDIEGRKLVFRRAEGGRANESGADRVAPGNEEPKKRRRHPGFGALKDVTWIAPGVDLTEPAYPEWADIVDDPNWQP